MNRLYCRALLVASSVVLGACAANQLPSMSPDGLALQDSKNVDEFYLLPGASLAGYTEIGVTPCTVSFRKNWLRDQNNNRLDLSNRVTQEDVGRIKNVLAADCNKFFLAALADDPAYTVVNSFSDGEDVLVVRPSIINLDVNAPDVMTSSMTRSYTTTAGEMTLVLELLDGTTGQVLARIVDRRQASDAMRLQWSSSVTNKAEADRMLKRWASELRKGLDAAMGS